MKNIRMIFVILVCFAGSTIWAQNNPVPKARVMYIKNKADQTFTYGQDHFSDSTLVDLRVIVGPLDSTSHRSFIIRAYDHDQSTMLSDTVLIDPEEFSKGKLHFTKTYPALPFNVDQGYILLLDHNHTLTDSLNIP